MFCDNCIGILLQKNTHAQVNNKLQTSVCAYAAEGMEATHMNV